MASFAEQPTTTIFNHFIKQNTHAGRKGQDGAASGTTIINGKNEKNHGVRKKFRYFKEGKK